ncbi:lytic transglycosylase domain-containing protein [Leptospira ognonensis]|uniref:Lytic transglycosylase domain-containing protein n=1 Tax=Leptospira ognonensis TaxID=2484945 RepID=A0A4R9K823_9LEPT|nr:lytic transglycosylase domain-containing protein [Leptospira ognonensis]TGL61802.1 lytic transglycosylase domain-containing protein [Leptospira ognonensis]
MEITSLPSLQSVFSRMRELENLVTNPGSAVSFPEMLEKQWKKETPGQSPTSKADLGFQPALLPPGELKSSAPSRDEDLVSFIEKTAKEKGIDPNLVKAVIKTESGFKPNAVSPKGALGLMQLMPSTADMLGVEDPLDPRENVVGGTTYLKDMLQKFGDTEKALAAYNAGPGAVQKYKGVPPYQETQDYINKVKKNYQKFSNAE